MPEWFHWYQRLEQWIDKRRELNAGDSRQVRRWLQEFNQIAPFERVFMKNFYFNLCLWKLEDKARDPKAQDIEIAQIKRAIDQTNQQRNDCIDQMNLELRKIVYINPDAPCPTETLGAAMDRLSIYHLKEYHLRVQLNETHLTEQAWKTIQTKWAQTQKEISSLEESIVWTTSQLQSGKLGMNDGHIIKMYNDPQHNPFLYAQSSRD